MEAEVDPQAVYNTPDTGAPEPGPSPEPEPAPDADAGLGEDAQTADTQPSDGGVVGQTVLVGEPEPESEGWEGLPVETLWIQR